MHISFTKKEKRFIITTKKTTSLALALVLCLSLCVPAFAAQSESNESVIQPRTGAVYYSSTPFYGTASSYSGSVSSRVASVAAEEFAVSTGYEAMTTVIGGIVGGPVGAAISAGFSYLVFSSDLYSVIMHQIGVGTINTSYYVKYTNYEPRNQPSAADGIFYDKLVVQYFYDSAYTNPVSSAQISYRKTVVNMGN